MLCGNLAKKNEAVWTASFFSWNGICFSCSSGSAGTSGICGAVCSGQVLPDDCDIKYGPSAEPGDPPEI